MCVETLLTNRKATFDTDDDTLEELRNWWSFSVPSARFSPKFKMGVWDGRIRLMRRNTVPAGLFRATRLEVEQELGVKFHLMVGTPKKLPAKATPEKVIAPSEDKYEYQDRCVAEMIRAIPAGGGIVLSATGTGKTALTAKFFSSLGCNCLFVVDTIDLLDQSKKELEFWMKEEVGIVGKSIYDPKRCTVATIQTLHKHIDDVKFQKWYTSVEIVVVDELHVQMARRNFDVLNVIQPVARYGLTATLQLKKKEIRFKAYAFAGPVLFDFPIKEGVEVGVLSDSSVVQLLFPATYEDDVEYKEHVLAEVVDNQQKLDAVRAIVDYLLTEDRRVVVLTERVRHLDNVHKVLNGIRHRVAYGARSLEERNEARARFESGAIKVLIANRVFAKGINLKRVDAIIDIAELKSKNTAQQKLGRGVRLHDDKDFLLYIDIGTQGKNRFGKAASSRRRAFTAAKLKTVKHEVNSIEDAVEKVKKCLTQMQRELPLK
jgi:superfamily II DNA or RNA helicase